MKRRNATAVWNGSGKEGGGHVSAQSGILSKAQYSYVSRFEEGNGTNPEELVAAAHSGCFSMKLAFVLGAAGFTPESIETTCTITLDNGTITTSLLEVKAKVPGIDDAKFQECANDAKLNCPVSKVLNATIELNAQVV